MQTTCPECRTTFRVSQDHLGARRGMVRCGTCQAVFNAYDTLLPELETPPADALEQAAAAMPSLTSLLDLAEHYPECVSEEMAVSEADVEIAQFKAEDSEPEIALPWPDSAEPQDGDFQAAQPEPVNFDTFAEESDEASVRVTLSATRPAADMDGHEVASHYIAAQDILLQPMWPVVDKPKRTWRFWLYLLLTSLLAGLLVMQILYFLRGELAAAFPATRPVLESLCHQFECTVPLPRQLNNTAIAASSLEHDPENKARVQLSLLLANRTEQAQAWPWITLILSDVRQAPVAQKMFGPSAYLREAVLKDTPNDLNIAAGLAAGSEHEIRLDLDIGNLVASGYTLKLSYR